MYNSFKLKSILAAFDKNSFVFDLTPYELVYLGTQNIKHVIHGVVNELLRKKAISIDSKDKISFVLHGEELTKEENLVTIGLKELGKTYYPALFRKLVQKSIFQNYGNWADAYTKYLCKSKKFAQIFYLNFTIFSLLFLFGLSRLVIGVLRDKAVTQISIYLAILFILFIYLLKRLTKKMEKSIIPDHYIQNILPFEKDKNDWQWKYFLMGSAVLATGFVAIANYVNTKAGNDGSSGGSCASSCGSSCGGSSCGSSCGGCGGD